MKFLALRDDGLGERLRAILNAMYLAKRLRGEFGFLWKDHSQKTKKFHSTLAKNGLAGISMESQERIFSQEFISRFSLKGQFMPTCQNNFESFLGKVTKELLSGGGGAISNYSKRFI
ncbi:hypothetical protein [Helicobacter burdigaliensis]|uniref:hypothetical protein n=1 Tax=Helicobacter burdigaliensis TaxID=2315334 RepID=UPI000EF6C962|nr:hypothetical protein [Helicobacter burdigaliensis]